MNVDVDYVSVMSNLGFDIRNKDGKYRCPRCFTKSFVIYPDQPNEMGVCHNKDCKWSGDAVKLYSDCKDISYTEAAKELGIALNEGFIQLKEQTYAEAKAEFAKDIEFLTWVRIYEAFYPDTERRFNRKIFAEKTGLKKGTLSKIINGKLSKTLTWRKVLAVLRSDLEGPIKELRKKIALGTQYFENQLDDELRGKDVEKFRSKKPKRSRAKIADKE